MEPKKGKKDVEPKRSIKADVAAFEKKHKDDPKGTS